MPGKWLGLSVLAVALGVGIGALSMRQHRPAPAPVRPTGAAVLNLNEITLSGKIRPQHITKVGAEVDGNIEAFLAEVGQDVFQGQVLARVGSGSLESNRESAAAAVETAQNAVTKVEAALNSARMEASRADADLQRSRIGLDRAQKTYDKQKTWHAAGATPRLVYEKAVQDFEAALKESEIMDKAAKASAESVQMATANLAAARKALTEATQRLEEAQVAFAAAEVRAPVDGLIYARHGEPGKPASDVGEDMFEIATDTYALEVPVDPKPQDLGRIHPGQQALVLILDLQSAGMPGVVKEIKDNQAIIEFTSALPAIKPGMQADVRLKLE